MKAAVLFVIVLLYTGCAAKLNYCEAAEVEKLKQATCLPSDWLATTAKSCLYASNSRKLDRVRESILTRQIKGSEDSSFIFELPPCP